MKSTEPESFAEIKESVKESIKNSMGPFLKISSEQLHLARNTSFAGGGTATICVLTIIPLNTSTTLLTIASILLSFSIPVFLYGAAVAEMYIWAGEESYAQSKEWISSLLTLLFLSSGYSAFTVGIILLIFHLNIVAGVVFVLSGAVALKSYNKMYDKLSRTREKASNQ